ncbi:MAG: hypothetical protein ACJ8DI_00755 [Ktedonobacteraceae bacterium]
MEQKSEVEARNSSIFDGVVEKKPPSRQTEQLKETYGQQQLPCIVVTQVDAPNDVFDVYGRFIMRC